MDAGSLKLALLANGPSLATHDLGQISLDVMGMNRSHLVYPMPQYHVVLDGDHFRQYPEWHESMARMGRLYVAGGAWDIGIKMSIRNDLTFSKDIREGVVTEMHGVGSVFYVALQVAYSLGYRTIFALGLDLRGDHFDGSTASPHVWKQNLMFAKIPPDLKVFTCGSPDSLAIFPKVGFEAVC